MFKDNSRYAKLPLKEFTDPAGRTISYVARRIIRRRWRRWWAARSMTRCRRGR